LPDNNFNVERLVLRKDETMNAHHSRLFGLALVLAFAGCASESADQASHTTKGPSADGARYLASSAPAAAQDVIPMRQSIDDQQEVVVIGRIGGSHNPWVDGMAAFTLVDRSLAACTDIPGDKCPTPWDYCCATDKLPDATTLVKVVDDQGQVVTTGAQELLGVDELQTVIVRGKARKDDAGNISILAEQIYVDPSNPGQVRRSGEKHAHGTEQGDDRDEHDHPEGASAEDAASATDSDISDAAESDEAS
jgi:hypothetical protein